MHPGTNTGGVVMAYLVRNISKGYARLLKHEAGPGQTIDLEQVFKGFCVPKVSSKDDAKKIERFEKDGRPHGLKAEFEEDEFDEFIDWVIQDVGINPTVWATELEEESPNIKVSKSSKSKERRAKKAKKATVTTGAGETRVEQNRKSQQTLLAREKLTAKEMAMLDPNDKISAEVINHCSDFKKVKLALRLAKNLSGQERIRMLLEKRVTDLQISGIARR
jgi:hypothetical protein